MEEEINKKLLQRLSFGVVLRLQPQLWFHGYFYLNLMHFSQITSAF